LYWKVITTQSFQKQLNRPNDQKKLVRMKRNIRRGPLGRKKSQAARLVISV